MFSFVNEAFAMAPPQGAEVTTTDTIIGFAPIVLLVIIFYFFLVRPQNKKQQEQRDMIANLREGDRVLTAGGLIGNIIKMKEDELTLEIAKDVRVKLDRHYVSSLVRTDNE